MRDQLDQMSDLTRFSSNIPYLCAQRYELHHTTHSIPSHIPTPTQHIQIHQNDCTSQVDLI